MSIQAGYYDESGKFIPVTIINLDLTMRTGELVVGSRSRHNPVARGVYSGTIRTRPVGPLLPALEPRGKRLDDAQWLLLDEFG